MTRFFASTLVAVALLASGCDDPNRDTDGDLLIDTIEAAIGTDPEVADTDGDGFSDAHEYLSYFDPNDDSDFPYTGNYPRLPLPDDIDDEGWDEGEVSRDWDHDDAEDQFEEIVALHRFYGNVVLLDIAAEWCGPCRAAAPETQERYDELKDQGFVIVNLMLDGLQTDQPPDLDRWKDEFDLTFPLIADHDQSIASRYIDSDGGGFSIPNFTVLGRDLEIVAKYSVGSPDWDLIEDLLEEDLPTVEWPLPENAEEIRNELELETLEVPYLVPGEGLPEGSADLTGGGDSSAEADGDSAAGSGSGYAEDAKAGRYAGPPFGGASCSASGSSASQSGLGLLFLLMGGLVLRRRI